MKVYCTDHEGRWPVGVASIVLAEDKSQARTLLDAALVECELPISMKYPYTLREVDLSEAQAIVLHDGDY